MDGRIFHIKNKLADSLGRRWSLEDMAVEVRISISHFHRLFKEQMDVSPMAYLNDLRLSKAREMLADSTCFMQVKEIGVEVGLIDESHFAREFKKKYGATPTDFRNQSWQISQSDAPDGQE